MNKIDVENRLNELKNCAQIVIYHNISGIYTFEIFYTKNITNCPKYNCLKCSVGDRTIYYQNIKSIGQDL